MKAKTHPPDLAPLLRQAATFGPGYRGQRSEPSGVERQSLIGQFEAAGAEPPAFLLRAQAWTDRRAKLFEAGDYPDKGIVVAEDNLVRLSESFDLPVPVLIEHASSPLQIGYLTDVQAVGRELFGTIALTKEANDLIEASGAHALSLGLDSSLGQIQEVSLVKKPRVPSARLFTGELVPAEPDWKARCHELERRAAGQAAADAWGRLLASGRMTPAQLPFAEALAGTGQTIQFDGASVPAASLVVGLLEAAPPHALFGELAPAGPGSPPALGEDERAFYDRYFAGLSLEEIAKNRGA